MKRLAIYAHFNDQPKVARYVLHYLKEIQALGFEICFVSNSPVSVESRAEVSKFCSKLIQRENSGLDFAMWKVGLAEYDLSKIDELLLTNSSIVGPLTPLGSLWQNPAIQQCDFWGLTDNIFSYTQGAHRSHVQSYFLVFRRNVLQSESFAQFWKSVLPYQLKWQVIVNYEIGLTIWLEENGFSYKVLCPLDKVVETYVLNRKKRGLSAKLLDRVKNGGVPAQLPGTNTSIHYPDILISFGMPFLKFALLKSKYERMEPNSSFKLLESMDLPQDVLEELQTIRHDLAKG